MAEKISVKTISTIFLLCTLALALCACMVPVDIQTFLQNADVQKTIEKSHRRVYVINKTEEDLLGLNARISGLANYKYYLIEKETYSDENNQEVNVTKDPPYPWYVTDYADSGGLNNDLGVITRIKGGSILSYTGNELVNYHTYTVSSAVPIKSSTGNDITIPYTVSGATVQIKVTTEGVLTVISGKDEKTGGTLDLSAVITGNYEVIAVKVDLDVDDIDYDPTKDSPWNFISKSTDPDNDNYDSTLSWDSFKLVSLDEASKVDYVFVKKGANIDFKVLRVETLPYVPPKVQFEITLTPVTEQAQASANNNKTISRGTFDGGSSVILTLTNPSSGTWTDIVWSIADDMVDLSYNNDSLTLVIRNRGDFLPILAANSFIVTVNAALEGVPYSANVTITVTD